MMRPLTLVLALGAMVLFACSPAPFAPATPAGLPLLPTAESTVTPTRSPTRAQPAPTELPPTAEPVATLRPTTSSSPNGWADDFSNPKSGWDVSSGKQGSVGYENGEYVIQVDEVDYSLWANPGRTFGDAFVGVRAQLADGSPPANMGLICRYRDTGNFIYGEITSDGFYSISQVKGGDLRVLTGGGKLQPHAAIRKGVEANQIQFSCAGNRITLIVNNQFVDGIEADAPASGDVGLIAGTFGKSGARIRYDDFSAVLPRNTEMGNLQPGGTVLFSDDFSNPKSGWDVRETASGATGYRDGRYFIRVDVPQFQLWSSPDQPFTGDVIVEASASPVHGPEKNEMGVFCRYQDRQNFVFGSVGADGYYAIVEIKNNKETILTGNGKFLLSDAIPHGSETYIIRLACEGGRYTLFVNGKKIDSASSSAFSGGDAGLLAGTFDQGGVEILFDDFKESRP